MSIKNNKPTDSLAVEPDNPLFFGDWLKKRRKELDLTQNELAERASCSVFALRKIEAGERRPSKQLAGLLVNSLEIPPDDQSVFIRVARGELNIERLYSISTVRAVSPPLDVPAPTSQVYLPIQTSTLIGREAEMAALGKLLNDPRCRLLTITGLGGIGKTRLAIELALDQHASFPGGVYYVSLASLTSPEFIVPAIGEVLGFQLSLASDPQEQLINHLAARGGEGLLLVLDNLEHLLLNPYERTGEDITALLLTALLQRLPNLKILATSLERSNLREEWIFELHGLPVPTDEQINGLEGFSAAALFIQCARQQEPEFIVKPDERKSLARVCQLVEGIPLAIELAATWISMLSMEEIAQEIASNLDFLTTRMRNIPERHRSLRAVFTHSWNLLSSEEKNVLSRLAVFRGGFQRQAAEQVAGASLPILMSLLSKSLLQRRENGRYDLHELIRQCALEMLKPSGHLEDDCDKHLAYFASLAREAQDGLRSAQLAEWLNRIEQEHNNIRVALEWAFSPAASPERVEEGICLLVSIDRFWAARGHIREGITWVERGLRACPAVCLSRAQALRIAGWLYNHKGDRQKTIDFLEESLAITRQLNDVTGQANVLDTLGDLGWRYGEIDQARLYYAESLELYRRGGDARKIGLSLASSGRMHVDYGYYPEAEILLTEGLSLLEQVSDLRAHGWCLNALGRLALFQGDMQQAENRFQQALRLNYELGYMVDIAEGLHSLAVVKAIAGEVSQATILWAAGTALQKKVGFTYSENDPIYHHAQAAQLHAAQPTEEWTVGEMMSPDQAVAFALDGKSDPEAP